LNLTCPPSFIGAMFGIFENPIDENQSAGLLVDFLFLLREFFCSLWMVGSLGL